MYRNMWHWLDGTVALYVNINDRRSYAKFRDRAYIDFSLTWTAETRNMSVCNRYICESLIPNQKHASHEGIRLAQISSIDSTYAILNLSLVKCPEGHVTRDLLSCDPQSQCGVEQPVSVCPLRSDADRLFTNVTKHLATVHAEDVQMIPKYVPMFECDQGRVSVAYSLVCDFKAECSDLSDEFFCQHIPCPEDKCRNKQCLPRKHRCDRVRHCYDSSDEVRLCLLQTVSR